MLGNNKTSHREKALWGTIGLLCFLIVLTILFPPLRKSYAEDIGPLLPWSSPGTLTISVIPHFMVRPSTVDKRYGDITKTNYPESTSRPTRILLLSPNHFDRGTKRIESIPSTITSLCYKDTCQSVGTLYGIDKAIGSGYGNNSYTTRDDAFTSLTNESNKAKIMDHGIGEHLSFIHRYFPESTIYPLLIDSKSSRISSATRQSIYNQITRRQAEGENVLVIASVDFSHYVSDDFAQLHDDTALYTMSYTGSTMSDFLKLEVDCPQCLWIAYERGKNIGQHAVLGRRDSAWSLSTGTVLSPTENTSRMFYRFENDTNTGTKSTQGITIAFFGDLMYDRGVKRALPTIEKFNKHFSRLYTLGDTSKDLATWTHRPLYGIDFVGLNLEMPVVKTYNTGGKLISPDCPRTSKQNHFCGDTKILPLMRDLGFNFVTMANNHAVDDAGSRGAEQTISNLMNVPLQHIGYLSQRNYVHNTVRTGTIRGIPFARHGFEFIIVKNKLDTYCDIIKSYKKQGYNNFVTVHRGTEYQTTHNAVQEEIAHTLIDCGAELIIGHHPHVVQDVGWYKHKPIIYSLGNFLFDQKMSKETKTGGYVLINRQANNRTSISTGSVDAYPGDE